MTPGEWAEVLGSLHGRDAERGQALREMSDEDWVPDDLREWVRDLDWPKKPACTTKGYYWIGKYQPSRTDFAMPARLILEQDSEYTHNLYSIDYPTPSDAWRAVLRAAEARR